MEGEFVVENVWSEDKEVEMGRLGVKRGRNVEWDSGRRWEG